MSSSSTSPALVSLIPDELRGTLRRAELRVDASVPVGRGGPHRSRAHGPGYDFRDHRPYVPGDDPRRLDWRAVARRDRLVVRRSEAQVALDVVLVIDAGGGMRYDPARASESKWARVRALAAWTAEVARRQGDAIGFAIGRSNDTHVGMPPSPSAERIRALASHLGQLEAAGACPWGSLLESVRARLPRRAVVIVLSDFWDPAPELDDDGLLGALHDLSSRGHVVAALQVLHPDEVEFPWTSTSSLRFEDLRGEHPAVEGSGAAQRTGYLEAARAHLDRFERGCEERGVRLVRHRTDQPAPDAALRLLRSLAGEVVGREDVDAQRRTGRAR